MDKKKSSAWKTGALIALIPLAILIWFDITQSPNVGELGGNLLCSIPFSYIIMLLICTGIVKILRRK
jgi:hypothetical protein